MIGYNGPHYTCALTLFTIVNVVAIKNIMSQTITKRYKHLGTIWKLICSSTQVWLDIFQLTLNWGEEWQCWGVFHMTMFISLGFVAAMLVGREKTYFQHVYCWSTSSNYCRLFQAFDVDSDSQICSNKNFWVLMDFVIISFSASTYMKATKPLTKFWYPTLCKARSFIQTDKSPRKTKGY